VLAALVATACSFAPADFTVVITQPDYTYTVRIYDASGLVDGASEAGLPPLSQSDAVVARPEIPSVDVQWIGGVCKRTPIIHVEGSATGLTVTVEPDATEGISVFVACADVGKYLGVTLSLNAAVSQESVTFVQK